MNAVLQRCFTLLLLLVTLSMVAFAGIRLATPWLAGQREAIEALASASLGRPVTIGAIAAEWRGLAPDLRLRHVKVKDRSGNVLLSFDEARLTPDLINSVVRGRAQLSRLYVAGADVHLVRRADGSVIVRGINRRQSRDFDPADLVVSLWDSRIRWEDRRLDVDYRLDRVDATLDARGGQTRVRARAALAGDSDSHIMLAANLRGMLARRAELRGNFYARAQDLPLAKLPARSRANVQRGAVSLEVWGDLADGRVTRVIGHGDIDDAVVAGERHLARVVAKFAWRARMRGWRLQLADVEVMDAGRGWRMASAGLDHRIAQDGQANYKGWLSHARVEDLLALLPRTDPGALAQKLAARAPVGRLSKTRFELRLKDGEIENYHVRGRFHDLSLAANPDTPGFAGADGRFALSRNEGALALRTRRLEVAQPRLFADTLRVDDLRGDLRWRRENGRMVIRSPGLAISNEDFAAHGPFELRVGMGQPYLDTQIALSRGNVAKAADYLPVKILSPRAIEWLRQALVAGKLIAGDVRFKGRIADFPFRDGGGDFEARLDLEQGILDYRPGWPKVEAAQAEVVFRGPSLSVTSTRARVLDSQIESAAVRIPDLREGDLHVKLEGRGPVNDIARYLQRSILVESKVFERLTIAGDSRLALDLRLPLAKETDLKETDLKRTDEQPRVSGRVRLDGATLRITPPDIEFTDIEGELAFGTEGFRGEALSGRFQGREVSADVAPAGDRRTDVLVRGRLPARLLLDRFEHPALEQVQGQSDWRARLRLPAFKKAEPKDQPRPIRFSLASSLQGTAVRLPQPLTKPAAARRPFRLVTAFGDARQHPIRVQYGRDLSTVFALSREPDGLRLARGELRVARGRATLPRAGVKVKAALAEFSVSDWAPWVDAGSPPAGDGGSILRELDVTAGHLQWSGRRFDNVRLTASRQNARWAATVESAQVAGRISMPVDMTSGAPLVANMRHLYLETVNGATSVMDPRKLPPLRVTSRALRIDGFEFNGLHLETARLKDGMLVRKLELSAPDFKGQARGRWRFGEAGHRSSFDFALDSGNLGEILRRWDLQHSVRDGVARVEAHLAWPDAPSRIDPAGLEGRARLRVQDGRLREINPGAGRLLGLFNLGAISRRLSLDFSDLFRTGLSFDTMTGDLRFHDTNMYTDNLVIDGPAAQIKITGRTGLVARDYDQRVVVVPEIMSGLPLAGALLGGPAVGATLFMAEKVFDELEDPGIDETEGILYTVTGPWEKPRIDPAEPRAQTAPPAKKFPYTIR